MIDRFRAQIFNPIIKLSLVTTKGNKEAANNNNDQQQHRINDHYIKAVKANLTETEAQTNEQALILQNLTKSRPNTSNQTVLYSN